MKKYKVSCQGFDTQTVTGIDSHDAKRKYAKIIKESGGFEGPADKWIKARTLNVECLEGQPASAPAKKALGKGIDAKKSEGPVTARVPDVNIPKDAPSVDVVIGWALYYVNKGIDWLSKNV